MICLCQHAVCVQRKHNESYSFSSFLLNSNLVFARGTITSATSTVFAIYCIFFDRARERKRERNTSLSYCCDRNPDYIIILNWTSKALKEAYLSTFFIFRMEIIHMKIHVFRMIEIGMAETIFTLVTGKNEKFPFPMQCNWITWINLCAIIVSTFKLTNCQCESQFDQWTISATKMF